jgi:ketosteroid isomerase-like protein
MSDESNKNAVLRMHEAIGRGDIDGMFAPMTDDVTFRVIGDHALGQRTYQGKEDITNNLLMTIFARLDGGVEVTIISIAAEDEKVFLHFTGKAQTVDGDPYNNEYVQLFSFRDGKISAVVEFMDTALLAKVLG